MVPSTSVDTKSHRTENAVALAAALCLYIIFLRLLYIYQTRLLPVISKHVSLIHKEASFGTIHSSEERVISTTLLSSRGPFFSH